MPGTTRFSLSLVGASQVPRACATVTCKLPWPAAQSWATGSRRLGVGGASAHFPGHVLVQAASFSLAQATTSYGWGLWSTQYGRKVRRARYLGRAGAAVLGSWASCKLGALGAAAPVGECTLLCRPCSLAATPEGCCVGPTLQQAPRTHHNPMPPALEAIFPTHTLPLLQPVMVLGSAVTTICLVWFGLSGSYGGACVARVVAGLCNGIICAWKCIIGDSCKPLLQVRTQHRLGCTVRLWCAAVRIVGSKARLRSLRSRLTKAALAASGTQPLHSPSFSLYTRKSYLTGTTHPTQ